MAEVELEGILKRLKKTIFAFSEPEIEESLMEDIKLRGIKTPIKLLKREDGTLELLDGAHRLAIAVKLDFTTVPAVIKNG